ncbi:MAG: GspH/FimT family protein [Oligoflexia bacterium]|nr:GspH/FimT family protein [Oligoflexia bacterium]
MIERIADKSRILHVMRGFTLLEVLVALCLLGMLTATAVPWVTKMKGSFDRRNARQGFEFDIRRARSEALSKGVRVVITVAANHKSYTIGRDVLPYDTANGNPDTVLSVTDLPDNVTLSFSGSGTDANKLIFTSRGFLSDIAGNRNTSQKVATLSYDGGAFATVTVYPVGVADFS